MANSFGISKVGWSLTESCDVEIKGEVKQLIDLEGKHSAARIVDTSFSFSVKGKGTLPVVVGGSDAPSGVSGKVIITKTSEMQTNDDWEGWSYDGVGYTYAS